MLKSNNFNSIMDDLAEFSHADSIEGLRPTTFDLETSNTEESTQPATKDPSTEQQSRVNNVKKTEHNGNGASQPSTSTASVDEPSLAALQLSTGVLQCFTPPLDKVRGQLKELICKQNKIYIDLSAEKHKLDNAEVNKLQDMMNDVKLYREKLLKIKKQMQNIYQRTKVLKKRSLNVQQSKEKELQRKIQKQQQEESLIGKQ